MSKKVVGITIRFIDKHLFTNGATQHVYTMAKLFQLLGWDACLITHMKDVPKDNNNFMNLPVISRYEMNQEMLRYKKNRVKPRHRLDLILCFEWYVKANWFHSIKQTYGCKIIKYQCGNLYETLEQKFLDGEDYDELNNYIEDYPNTIDGIWVSPHYETRLPIYDTLYHTKSVVFPYLWEPDILFDQLKTENKELSYHQTLQQTNGSFRVGICEPNRDILKSSMVPLIGSILAMRAGVVDRTHIFSGHNVKQSVESILKIMRCPGSRVTYNQRGPIVQILQVLNAIICHQHDHMLNYIYLEVPLLGFPLLHNSPMCKEIGYYYSDVSEIPRLLHMIKQSHNPTQCIENTKRSIHKYSIHSKENQEEIQRLIRHFKL